MSASKWLSKVTSTCGRLGLLVALFGATSCTEIGRPLTVQQAQSLDPKATSCMASDSTSPLAEGTLDVALDLDYPYILFPMVVNQLTTLEEPKGIELNVVNVTAAEVSLKAPTGITIDWNKDCPAKFDTPVLMRLGPGDKGIPPVEIVRRCHSSLFRKLFVDGKLSSNPTERVLVIASLRVKARHGGATISSDPFDFPVRVCYGCLQRGYSNPAYAPFEFPSTAACDKIQENPFPGNACNPGQDDKILCCMKDPEKKLLECPGRPRAPAAAATSSP